MNSIRSIPINKKVKYKEYYKITDRQVQEFAKEYILTIEEAHVELNEYAGYYYQ